MSQRSLSQILDNWNEKSSNSNVLSKMINFAVFVDVMDGNPNGDPDAGNLPRMDVESGHGLMTDTRMKRWTRDAVISGCEFKNEPLKGLDIYIKPRIALNTLHEEAYARLEMTSTGTKQARPDVAKASSYMCDRFFDVRTFGAAMETSVNCGTIKGPVQIGFGRSFHPINVQEHCLTRVAVTRKEDMEFERLPNGESKGKTTEMGRKATVSYGLYRFYGTISPALAKISRFTELDLELLWATLREGPSMGQSAASGIISTQKIIAFYHDNPLGSGERAYELFNRISVNLRNNETYPRTFTDYQIAVNTEGLPPGISVHEF